MRSSLKKRLKSLLHTFPSTVCSDDFSRHCASKILRRSLATGMVVLLWPWYAEAHLVTTGLGPVYDGVGHLMLTPEDLVPVIALALFAGLRGAGDRTSSRESG